MSQDENDNKMIYRELREFSDDKIAQILKKGDIEDLYELPFSVGEYHSNWKFAQDICIQLSSHPDERVRANAMMGLAYIARTKGKLEKNVVKPVVLRALRELKNSECIGMVADAIGEINLFMKWSIRIKHPTIPCEIE